MWDKPLQFLPVSNFRDLLKELNVRQNLEGVFM